PGCHGGFRRACPWRKHGGDRRGTRPRHRPPVSGAKAFQLDSENYTLSDDGADHNTSEENLVWREGENCAGPGGAITHQLRGEIALAPSTLLSWRGRKRVVTFPLQWCACVTDRIPAGRLPDRPAGTIENGLSIVVSVWLLPRRRPQGPCGRSPVVRKG